jgi:hypothetical protein
MFAEPLALAQEGNEVPGRIPIVVMFRHSATLAQSTIWRFGESGHELSS